MWEITTTQDDRRVFVVGIGETFDGLSDAEKGIVYESAKYLKNKVELDLAKRVGEICNLVDSLTDEEWSKLPPKVCDFLIQYKHIEEDDDD